MSKCNVCLLPFNEGSQITNSMHVTLWNIPEHRQESSLQRSFSRDISTVLSSISGGLLAQDIAHQEQSDMSAVRLLHCSAKSAPHFCRWARPAANVVATMEDTPSPLIASQRMAKQVTHTLVVSHVSVKNRF